MFWYPKKRSPGRLTEDPENKPQRWIALRFFIALLVAVPLVLLIFVTISTIREKSATPAPTPISRSSDS